MVDQLVQTPTLSQDVEQLKSRILQASLPPDLKDKTLQMVDRLERIAKYGNFSDEYDKVSHYLDWILALPWNKSTNDLLDLPHAKAILDKNHFAMNDLKERILEFLATIKLNRHQQKISHAPILCLVGLVGTGKTTFAYSLAEAMGRKFCRIPFGGMGSSLDLRGQSRLHSDAQPGLLIKAIRRAQTKNPVILLDEIDRTSHETQSDIMGVLVELLDPEQNQFFTDHYIDYPFDLSDVLFVATCNNTTNIATAVLDRMEVLQMPSYTDEEKIAIAQKYLLPRALHEAGLGPDNLTIDPALWSKIVRPLGFDSGMRSLERNIDTICRKVAKLVVEGKGKVFNINEANLKQFLELW